MLEDGIFSVRFLCAEMCMQPHSWALCDAGGAASADYPVALTCASTLASFAAFRDCQKETAGQLLGFSLCCVRAESTGDHRDVATRNANVALRDGDSWLSRGSIKATAYGRVGGRSYLGEGQPKWPIGEGCRPSVVQNGGHFSSTLASWDAGLGCLCGDGGCCPLGMHPWGRFRRRKVVVDVRLR